MARAATLCRLALTAALAAPTLCAMARAGQGPADAPRPDLKLQVVVLSATGRAVKPQFDPRTPAGLRKQIEGQNLAYGKYDLWAIKRQDARFGADVNFDLPDKETLVVKPSRDEGSPARVSVLCRLLDGQKKPILVNTTKVAYDRAFMIQRLKGPATSVLMGISASRPSDDPRK